MINIKTKREIGIMKEAGRIAADAREELVKAAKPGVKTQKLDQLAEKLILEKGAAPSFKGYRGYPASIVTCVNEEVVHGIPGDYELKSGDLLTIDLGVYYKGFHSDTATTILIPPGVAHFSARSLDKLRVNWRNLKVATPELVAPKIDEFLQTGQRALEQAINQVRPGNQLGDISSAIQTTIESGGFSVVRDYVGHGIGRSLHESPQIPCFGEKGKGEILRPGMTLAIEVMYCMGGCKIKILGDGWTAVTLDKSLSAMFEHTVAVTSNSPLILTQV